MDQTATNETAATTSLAPSKPVRKAAAKKAAKPAKSSAKLVKKTDGDRIALKSICSRKKIEPRLARRKLRAAGLAFHDPRDRWTFTKAQAARVEEILSA